MISHTLVDHTLLYELLNVIGHLGPKYSVLAYGGSAPCPGGLLVCTATSLVSSPLAL